MREIKVKDKNGLIHKFPGRIASGICDADEREIYEGDVLRMTKYREEDIETYITDVIFEDGGLSIKGTDDDSYHSEPLAAWSGDPDLTYPKFEMKIIGSIYEHPHLLD